MRHALGSNRAEYGRQQDLRTQITVARSAMQLPVLNLKRKTVDQLKAIWRETYEQAKAAGLIR